MSDLIARFERELGEKPDDPGALSNLATALQQAGRREEALPHYLRAVALAPEQPIFRYNLANTLRELGRLEESAEHCRRALALKPPRQVAVAAAFCLGDCLKARGELEAAAEQYRFVLEIDRRYGPARYNLANTLRDLGRVAQAVAEYFLALEGQHDRPLAVSIHVNLGLLFEKLGELDAAIGHFGAALTLAPEDRPAGEGLLRVLTRKRSR